MVSGLFKSTGWHIIDFREQFCNLMVLNGVGIIDVYLSKDCLHLLIVEFSNFVQHFGEALQVY